MPQTKRILGLLIASMALISISLQLFITDFGILTYFSFFTSLSNLLVAVCLFSSILVPDSATGKFYSSLSVQTAIALYIFIVALVYNLVLRGLWQLTGLEFVLDNMVHVVVPALFFIYWLIYLRPTAPLKWSDALLWLVFPFLYLVYTLTRGTSINWYPYPFLNAQKLGYARVMVNIGWMLLAFAIVGLFFIYATRLRKKVEH